MNRKDLNEVLWENQGDQKNRVDGTNKIILACHKVSYKQIFVSEKRLKTIL